MSALVKSIANNKTLFLSFWITSSSFSVRVKEFIEIWSISQWTTSLTTLVCLYWVTGICYNRYLARQGQGVWMTNKDRVLLILFDLFVNLGIGIYYMGHRDTLLGALMVKCPIYLSPIFWVIELIMFYFLTQTWPRQKPKLKKLWKDWQIKFWKKS